MKIHFEKGLQLENAQLICQWSNTLGESFQKQWMGPKISYPLIAQSLQKLEGIFSIFVGEEFVGVIQKIKLEDKNLHIGRFLIAPQKQGKGIGRKAFQDFVQEMFENEDIDTISLNVFEANQRAKNLYQKEGFEIVQMVEVPVRKYMMRKYR
ncbi:GNAT family N-acetyltransferase [Streptococcus taonis]|uniref:GNAT family N-acetyltransferase n=1 Tax=Streptococcus taonis TaxID=3041623 RepID=A0ABT6PE13_9STRE|nr:GNAT family N-acetyltransferase [Streptococcus sp. ST22-14]MDI1474238.1 GNAT family N-acetyltransferase [Streptococcus sp. ST22-14]